MSGITFALFISLISCAHTITIDSMPRGAEVIIGEEVKGNTPYRINSSEIIKQELILINENNKITCTGLKKRYWGFAYSKMVKSFFWGLKERYEDEKEKVNLEIQTDRKKEDIKKRKTCSGFFSCFLEDVCFMIFWSVPSVFVGLPSIITPDIYIFNMDIQDEDNKYNFKWLDYELVSDMLREYGTEGAVFLNKEYHEEIREIKAPYYYKGFGVYNREGHLLAKLIDIRKNATGLMFGAMRYTRRVKFDRILNEKVRKGEYSFITELIYSRVLAKNISLTGNSGITGGDYYTREGNYGVNIFRSSFIVNYNYSPFPWLGISPGFGAGLFLYDEEGSSKNTLFLPVTSLDINLSPNSWFNFAFVFTGRLNGFGLLIKNESPVDSQELLGGFKVMF